MSTYAITGTNRGIGLNLVTFLAARPAHEVRFIAAAARSKSSALQNLIEQYPGRVIFVPLEVTKKESAETAVHAVEQALGDEGGIDVLVNNAGVMPLTPGGIETMDDLVSTLEINVNGAQIVTAAFLPLLRKGARKLVVNVSSTLGSLTLAHKYVHQPAPAYKISKTALNMLTRQWGIKFAQEGFTFICIDPGWLQTDMGSQRADLPVEVGTKAVLEIIDNAKPEDNGKYLDVEVPGWAAPGKLNQYKGGELPW